MLRWRRILGAVCTSSPIDAAVMVGDRGNSGRFNCIPLCCLVRENAHQLDPDLSSARLFARDGITAMLVYVDEQSAIPRTTGTKQAARSLEVGVAIVYEVSTIFYHTALPPIVLIPIAQLYEIRTVEGTWQQAAANRAHC
ncbi:hypothetical protein V8C44DRAFT_366872 [Trichoderma aethiopicum]